MNRMAVIGMLAVLHPGSSLVHAQNEPAFRNAVVSYVELQHSELLNSHLPAEPSRARRGGRHNWLDVFNPAAPMLALATF